MDIILNLAILGGGIVAAVAGANILVDGASSIAARLRVSSLVIGMTVVAFGTSMPEFAVNIFSSIHHNTDLAIGNILGSNIFNIFIILGIVVLIRPLPVDRLTVSRDIPMNLLAAVLLGICGNTMFFDGLSRSALMPSDGLVFIALFGIFLYYTFYHLDRSESATEAQPKRMPLSRAVFFILAGLGGLVGGGELIVRGAGSMAGAAGLSDHAIGLFIVGPGTSIPELLTSVIAVRKGRVGLAVGNVVGSNIFNIFFILGLSSVIYPLPLSEGMNISVLTNILASLLLLVFSYVAVIRKLTRIKGSIFLALYVAYMLFMLMSNL
jgi:cation:H+ antiporter